MGLLKLWISLAIISLVFCYTIARDLEAEEQQEREYYEKHRDYFLANPNDRSDHFLRPKTIPSTTPDPHSFNSVVGTTEEQQERDYYERNRDYFLKNPNERSDHFLRPDKSEHSIPPDTHSHNGVGDATGNSEEQEEREYYERNRDFFLEHPNERSDYFLKPKTAPLIPRDHHDSNSPADTGANPVEEREREYYERNRDYYLQNPNERSDHFLRPEINKGPLEEPIPHMGNRQDPYFGLFTTENPIVTTDPYKDYYRTSTPQSHGSFDPHRQRGESYQPYDPYRREEAQPNYEQPQSHANRYDAYKPEDRSAHVQPQPQPYDPYRREEEYDRRPQPHDNRYDPYRREEDDRRNYVSPQSHISQPDPYRRADDKAAEHSRHQPQSIPRVNIPGQGSLTGATAFSAWTGRPFSKFLGIKYAHVGKGEKRFQKAEEVRPWVGEFDASKEPPSCPSFPNLNKVRLEERQHDVEDCLTLSIYTPDVQGRFPVMFYIHGEFFFDGTSQEAQPDYLLEKNIVLVAVEYRLAPFGFLALPNEKIPGNAAVTDIIAALKWVQKNIRHFGGDPRRVTLVGQGAGASMAHLLSITPYVEANLFHQVILQSGTALNPYLLTNTPTRHTIDIAKKAGCRADSNDDIADCLTRLSTSQVLQAFLKHCQENEAKGVGHYGGFQLTIGDFYGIIPKHPFDLAREYDGENYVILGGVTSRVGSFYYSKIYSYIQRSPRKDLDSLIDVVLKHTIGKEDDTGIWENLITSQLVGDEQRRHGTVEESSKALIDLVSNVLYKAPLLEALQQNAKFDPNGTYLYSFDYEGTHKRYRFAPLPFDMGVTLSDDNIYLYPYPEYVSPLDENDEKIAHIMVDLWTSFATTGVPQSPSVTDWPQMHMITGPYLSIDQYPEVNDDFVHEFAEYISSNKVFNAVMGAIRAAAGKRMFS